MSTGPSQQNIWSHFQNHAPAHVFQASHARHAAILRKIRRLALTPKPHVLNIGIGDGNLERTAQGLGWSIYSLDPDAQAIGRICEQGIRAETGSIEAIPFPNDHFDFIVASEVLEHLTDKQRQTGLREIQRVLKPDGHLIGTVPYQEDLELNIAVCPNCRHVFHRWGHTTAFDLRQMQAELAPYFGEISCQRTAFVEFRGRRFSGKIKSLLRLMLAKRGAAIAMPNIFFVARKMQPC
jgi:2-polyprenyl-3-methyl-5-hydroxy-6-metoxy-1,4-benzoquinol methylase